MGNDFIGSHIRRSNRNLLAVNLLVFVVAGVFIMVTHGFVAGFLFGGAHTDAAAVAGLGENEFKVLEIDAANVQETGHQKIEKKNGTDRVIWEYLAIPAGDRVLVVQAKAAERGPHFSGVLKPLPSELASMIQQDIKDPATRARVLPVMLDAIEYRGDAWLMLLIPFPLLLLSGWNLKKWMQRASDPTAHPIYKALMPRGGMMAEQQINSEMAQAPAKIGKSFLTKNWILSPYFFGMHVMHVDDVVWIYKKVVKHYHYFIPTGKTFAAMLCAASGRTIEISDKEKPVDAFLTAVSARAPWVAAGFSKELQDIWTSNRDALVQAVNQRRSTAAKTVSTPAAPMEVPATTLA